MDSESAAADTTGSDRAICGIIMPISAMPPRYEASHWSDVRKIFDTAILKAGMTPQIVSDSFESDVIQRRIVSNLYDNPVVVCDVSGLNPNVMFELGMRITFKQPVIVVTDDIGSVPFDTKIIEHLSYPRDLHIHQCNEFIDKLAAKIVVLREQKANNTFVSFIETFGTFEVLEPTKKVVEADKLILDRLESLDRAITRALDRSPAGQAAYRDTVSPTILRVDFVKDTPEEMVHGIIMRMRNLFPQATLDYVRGPKDRYTITASFGRMTEEARNSIEERLRRSLSADEADSSFARWA